jgi:hypothetical protein
MKNFAFCTLTYGEKYIKFGDSLIKQLNDMGYHVFVLTDDVNHYSPSDLLTPIEYKKEYFSFHEKRVVVQECLKHYETAIFLDADVYIKDTDNLDIFETVEPGLHIFANFGHIGHTFLNDDITKCGGKGLRNTKYGKRGLELLNKLGYQYERLIHDNLVWYEHFLEGRWMIKKNNGNEDKFFEIWDSLVEFCEQMDIELGYVDSIGAGEGSVMSISAYNSGIKVHSVSNLVGFIIKHFISNYEEKVNNIKPWNISG